jgi:N-methylhydantoinase A/oxoprolinase/acetone carboxylase beta subunit
MRPMLLIGIDVGGTFTDLTAIDEATGRVVVTKVPSRQQQEASAVLAGVEALGIASPDAGEWSTAPPWAPMRSAIREGIHLAPHELP